MPRPYIDVRGLDSAHDRMREAGWHLRKMQVFYHDADPYRWSLNCFLRALKEVPQLIRMEAQQVKGFKEWFAPHYAQVKADPLIAFFAKRRDWVVHKGMLKPASSGYIGITEGRGMKIGMKVPIDPLSDSDDAMMNYIITIANDIDLLEVLTGDDESMPCIERTWSLEGFSDAELNNLAADAWDKMDNLLSDTIVWLGGEAIHTNYRLSSRQSVRIKTYDRANLRQMQAELLEVMNADGEEGTAT